MLSLLIGVGVFAGVLGFVNTCLIKKLQLTYSKHFWLFIPLYVASMAFSFLLVPASLMYVMHWLGLGLFLLTATVFIGFNFMWGRFVDVSSCYTYQEIPNHFKSILYLDGRRGLTKVFEIFFQQVCALFIVVGLIEVGLSVVSIILLFTGTVFLLHITSPKWFGRVYGNYFLWAATLLAPLEVYFILEYSIGLYLAAILHIIMYMVMYAMAYLLRK